MPSHSRSGGTKCNCPLTSNVLRLGCCPDRTGSEIQLSKSSVPPLTCKWLVLHPATPGHGGVCLQDAATVRLRDVTPGGGQPCWPLSTWIPSKQKPEARESIRTLVNSNIHRTKIPPKATTKTQSTKLILKYLLNYLWISKHPLVPPSYLTSFMLCVCLAQNLFNKLINKCSHIGCLPLSYTFIASSHV